MNIAKEVDNLKNQFDSNKRPLTFKAQELAYLKTNKIVKLFKSHKEYKYLCSFFNSKLVELYFFKSIFESILYLQQLSLLNPNGFETKRKILLNNQNSYLKEELVYKFFPEFKDKLIFKKKYFFLKKIKSLLIFAKKKFLFKKKIISQNIPEKKNKLGIATQNGVRETDGDLSHLKYSSLDKSSIIIYFETLHKLKSLGGKKYLDYLNENKFNYVVLETIDFNIDVNWLKNIKKSIKKYNNKNYFKYTLIKITDDLIDEVIKYYVFFKYFKIKINFDSEPGTKSIITKQIALKLNNGFSFHLQRSYPSILKSQLAAHHPVDYLFCWGSHSHYLWKKSYNYINKIIIVGKLWEINSTKTLDKNLNKFLDQNNGNYLLLIFDTNHSTHNFSFFDNYSRNNQFVETSEMDRFYSSLINLLHSSDKLKILIKTKKKKILENLKVYNYLSKNKNIFIIDNDNFELLQIKQYISLSVSICFYSPSVFFESIACNIRSVCYDYSNIFNEEKKSFKSNFNSKNIYENLETLIEDIKKDLNRKSINKKSLLGYWKHETRKEIVNNIEETGFKKVYQTIDNKLKNIS